MPPEEGMKPQPDEGPAGAAAAAGGFAAAGDRRIEDHPIEERRQYQPKEPEREQRQQRIGNRAEEVAAQPIEKASRSLAGTADEARDAAVRGGRRSRWHLCRHRGLTAPPARRGGCTSS